MKRLIILTVLLLLLVAVPAQAATVLHDNETLEGGTYGTVIVQGDNVTVKDCTITRLSIVGRQMGVVVKDSTVKRLVTGNVLDFAVWNCTVSTATISGQNVGLTHYTGRSLVLRGELFFLDWLDLTGPLTIDASHVRVNCINMRLPDRSGLCLIQGRGKDVIVQGFTTWGGFALIGRVGADWLVWNGFHHGARMLRWGPNVWPWPYPIGDGVLLYEMR